MDVYHSTTKRNVAGIRESGLKEDSYVTDHDITKMSGHERHSNLCLSYRAKGNCVCIANVEKSNLIKPLGGNFTCKGLRQYQTIKNLPPQVLQCQCEENNNGIKIVFSIGIFIATLWMFKKLTE